MRRARVGGSDRIAPAGGSARARPTRRRCVAAALLALALLACEAEPVDEGPAPPLLPRAVVVVDPPRPGVGQVASVELRVVTPPGHRVRPMRWPRAVEGFWLLEAEVLPLEREGGRWLHRERLRVRPREAGTLVWPPLEVTLETPESDTRVLLTEAHPIEVDSALARLPDRSAPFPLRPPPPAVDGRHLVLAFAAGALFAWAAVAGVALVRRRRARARALAPPPEPAAARPREVWERALARLERAREGLPDEPARTAGEASLALRRYLEERFRLPATRRTTEELARAKPPFALARRWPILLELFRTYDDARFRPGSARNPAVERTVVTDALARSERFVRETVPAGEAR